MKLPRALAAALALIVLTSNATSSSAIFIAYRHYWGLTPADLGIAFSVYVGTLVPVLVLFGGLTERYGRRRIVLAGMLFMLAGTLVLLLAHGLAEVIFARLLQGIGAGLAVGVMSASFTEAYSGRIAAGQALAVVTAAALSGGPVLTAIAYDLGGGTNWSYLPILILGIAALVLVPSFQTHGNTATTAAEEGPLPEAVVWCGLRFAMPMVFVAWAGTSLYLSLVPAYLAASLHAADPLVGAGAFVATQLATVAASIRFGNVSPERSGPFAPLVVIFGLALLIVGTNTNLWWLIAFATLLVGAGGGVASGAAYAITARVGRGQRARVFARLLVAAYLGYSIPSLLTGLIAARTSFTTGFATVIAGLAILAAALPLLRARSNAAMRAHLVTPSA
jgi:predicted MFS family arabinose efflux permease